MKRIFAERNGGREAKGLIDKPNIDFISNWYLNVFGRLTTSRPTGFSISYIPLSEIVNYANNVANIEEDIEDFVDIVQSLDKTFVEYHSKKQ